VASRIWRTGCCGAARGRSPPKSTGFLHDPQSGGSPGPAANSVKPDVDGHRASRMTHGECACHHSPARGPVVAVRGPATGRADRDRSIKAGYLAESQHHMLSASRRSRRQRTESATEVQSNSLKLPRANRRSPSAARQR
jgi:hypothetical protein